MSAVPESPDAGLVERVRALIKEWAAPGGQPDLPLSRPMVLAELRALLPTAGDEGGEACDCECTCVGMKHHWASCNLPRPTPPVEGARPEELMGWHVPIPLEQGPERDAALTQTIAHLADDNLHLRSQVGRLIGGLGGAVKDVCHRAVQYGETEDGDTFAYLVTKGAMHRLIGQAQGNGVSASFRNGGAPQLPDPTFSERLRELAGRWAEAGGIECAGDLRLLLDEFSAPTPTPPVEGARPEGVVAAKIEASSLGTPEAQALRVTVSDERAARVVARSKELGAEAVWDEALQWVLNLARNSNPHYAIRALDRDEPYNPHRTPTGGERPSASEGFGGLTAPVDPAGASFLNSPPVGLAPEGAEEGAAEAPADEALAGLVRWLSNEGEGGIWESLISTTARPLAEALLRSSWLAAQLLAAESRGAERALRDAAASPWMPEHAAGHGWLTDRADKEAGE